MKASKIKSIDVDLFVGNFRSLHKNFTKNYDPESDSELTYRILRRLEIYYEDLGIEVEIEKLRLWSEEQKRLFFSTLDTILGFEE